MMRAGDLAMNVRTGHRESDQNAAAFKLAQRSNATGWKEALDACLKIVRAQRPLFGNRGEPSRTVASRLDYIIGRIEALRSSSPDKEGTKSQ